MPQIEFGKVLREARERKGYDLETAARRLRIRPDILKAIENNDFASMPPRGYSRNMVNAYARLLGLNPTEIVNMYLDDVYAYQVNRARNSAFGMGFVMDGGYRRKPHLNFRSHRDKSERSRNRDDSASSYAYSPSEDQCRSRTSRHLYDDRTKYAHDGYGASRITSRIPDADRDYRSHHSGYADFSNSEYADLQMNLHRRGCDIRVGETSMQYAPSFFGRLFHSRAALIVALAAVVIIVLVILFMAFGSKPAANEADVSQLPVSGITDTTTGDDQGQNEEVQVEIAPTSAKVSYSVKAGNECYVMIESDEKGSSDEALIGPEEKTVEVTGVWTIATWTPENLELVVDGDDVELTPNQNFGGMYAYTVDFPTILSDWEKTHGTSEDKRNAAKAQAERDNNAAAEGRSDSTSGEEN